MSESVHTNTSLWSKGMKAVIVAQFLSAFGDNALLFATLALLKAQFYPEWSQPILQMVFVGAYILFAPFVGQVADSFAKGRVMTFNFCRRSSHNCSFTCSVVLSLAMRL